MAYEKKLIEGSFPCQEVGAETKRERGASSALPPLYFLHVWWARRPLTPSRAAILGSILSSDTNPNDFLKELGIKKYQIKISDTLLDIPQSFINENGKTFHWSKSLEKIIDKDNKIREQLQDMIKILLNKNPEMEDNLSIKKLIDRAKIIDKNSISILDQYSAVDVPADPAWFNDILNIFSDINIRVPNLYGYNRAYENLPDKDYSKYTVLDPTSGGGSIPFEAMRLGCNVIANDLNPVATGIEYATLKYPAEYGHDLVNEINFYGEKIVQKTSNNMSKFFPQINSVNHDTSYLYCREVTCPHCGEHAPLLNAFALSKKKDGWMVIPQIDEKLGHKDIRFIPVRLNNGKGPNGEDPEQGTVKKGIGRCLCCGQAIDSDEIKHQARGESQLGSWSDRLYCVVGTRVQAKKDKDGQILRYNSGKNKGKEKTEKVTYYREPVESDYIALEKAEKYLKDNWNHFDEINLIPTERIPEMNDNRPLNYGTNRWCDMFTPRQLLGHLIAMESLQELIPEIRRNNGEDKGNAIVHYLQYMIDKCLDYNSRQTRWEYTRGVVKGTFGRHDFSLKWTFGEMIFSGENSGLLWGKSQVIDAYLGICDLIYNSNAKPAQVINGSAANINIPDSSVDVICVDPPYYNNVQYAELSDYFYVWQKRTFEKLYPEVFSRRLTNKRDEAVANPVRDGSVQEANDAYEQRMSEIFAECRRVIKDDGILTMMFTHKTQEAWETLTRALIENGWIISSSFPVDSESSASMHQKDMAAAASSIFIACRKRDMSEREASIWSGFGGTGVRQQIHQAVEQSLRDFSVLHLNAVDEMVASYGSALKVLSENWPVMDGDEMVSPIQAMREASTVVAQYQMGSITGGRLSVNDLKPEASIALTMLGIYGTGYFAYDDALSLSKSLNIRLENKTGGYHEDGEMIGINDERSGRRQRDDEEEGYFAPLVKKGSKLRLVLPEERNARRLSNPQQEWDVVQGMIMAYREGDIPVARDYLQKHASGNENRIMDILKVWADNCGKEDWKKETQRMMFGLKA